MWQQRDLLHSELEHVTPSFRGFPLRLESQSPLLRPMRSGFCLPLWLLLPLSPGSLSQERFLSPRSSSPPSSHYVLAFAFALVSPQSALTWGFSAAAVFHLSRLSSFVASSESPSLADPVIQSSLPAASVLSSLIWWFDVCILGMLRLNRPTRLLSKVHFFDVSKFSIFL